MAEQWTTFFNSKLPPPDLKSAAVEFAKHMKTPSPALKSKAKDFPARFSGRVPKKIKMLTTVYPHWPPAIKPGTMLEMGQVYDCWVNIHGAVSGWCDNGEKLGVTPGEFDVVEWQDDNGTLL